MKPAPVTLITSQQVDACEVALLRGALRWQGIDSLVVGTGDLGRIPRDSLAVALAPLPDAQWRQLQATCPDTPPVFAGHRVTLDHLLGKIPPHDGAVLVYGEPFATVTDIARNPALARNWAGQAVLGRLLDLSEYTEDPSIGASPLVVTAAGCEKGCGFCTYGATCQRLYGSAWRWRARPADAFVDDVRRLRESGSRRVWLAGQQVLSRHPGANGALLALARRVHGIPSLELHFEASPIEVVNNRELLAELAARFELRVKLGIESVDDETLRLLDLPHDSAMALEALSVLLGLGATVRLNYILVRPGLTLGHLTAEVGRWRDIHALISRLAPAPQLLIASDLLFRALRLHPCMPVCSKVGCNPDYEDEVPVDCIRRICRMRECLAGCAEPTSHGFTEPLKVIVDAGLAEAAAPA